MLVEILVLLGGLTILSFGIGVCIASLVRSI